MSETTVAFVDLAGFTALTEVYGDEAAATLVDDFRDSGTVSRRGVTRASVRSWR